MPVTKRLKVFHGSPDGRMNVILATTSIAQFCKITGCKREHSTQTTNESTIATAMSEPGVMFWRRIGDYSGAFTKKDPK